MPAESAANLRRSSLPREKELESSHSRSELIVRRSSRVIESLRGSGFWTGCFSGKNGSTLASVPGTSPASIAIPTSVPVIVFVAERVSRRVSASPSKYVSWTSLPPRATRRLVIFLSVPRRTRSSISFRRIAESPTEPGLAEAQPSLPTAGTVATEFGAREAPHDTESPLTRTSVPKLRTRRFVIDLPFRRKIRTTGRIVTPVSRRLRITRLS